jgi:PTH1 family peptidyl-tRNA hydrolase
MILIVGLGNPEKKYEGTRHNVGFRALDALSKEIGADFKMSEKFNSEIAESTMVFDGEKKHAKVMLVKPQTYMNNSGEAVAKLVNFYKFRTDDQVFVIHDDLDIELGMIRIRISGSSAGQKGIQSIIDKLGSDKFVRFRMGIKPKSGQPKPAEEFVLEKFRPEEKKIIDVEIKQVVDLVIESIDNGIIQTSI